MHQLLLAAVKEEKQFLCNGTGQKVVVVVGGINS